MASLILVLKRLRGCSKRSPALIRGRSNIYANHAIIVAKTDADMIQHDASEEKIKAYKALLTHIIDNRPAGTRQRLADALGKHRSFITQITSSFYPTPVPERHLSTIFSVCQFTDQERRNFLSFYDVAHPKRPKHKQDFRSMRQLSILVPDLGEGTANRKFDEAVTEFALRIGALLAEQGAPDIAETLTEKPKKA
jgi:hypothetical protein